MPAIVLIRHGQASYGAADYDVLSERGHEQAALTYAELGNRNIEVARVVSGSLRRQRETAQPFADAGHTVTVDERWNEYSSEDVLNAHGDPSVSPEAGDGKQVLSQRDFQTAIDAALRTWVAAGDDSPADETHPMLKGRVLAALADACEDVPKGGAVVIHTSAGIVGICCAAAAGLPDVNMISFNRISVNASLTKLISGGTGLTLVSFNEHGHLEAAGMVTYR